MSAADLTDDELRSAWQAMRTRPGLCAWPQQFEDVMADERRARCVTLEATAARRSTQKQQVRRWAPQRHARVLPPAFSVATDLKRAAAGERDDD